MKLTLKNVLVVNIQLFTFTGCQFKLKVIAKLLLRLANCMQFMGINKLGYVCIAHFWRVRSVLFNYLRKVRLPEKYPGLHQILVSFFSVT